MQSSTLLKKTWSEAVCLCSAVDNNVQGFVSFPGMYGKCSNWLIDPLAITPSIICGLIKCNVCNLLNHSFALRFIGLADNYLEIWLQK